MMMIPVDHIWAIRLSLLRSEIWLDLSPAVQSLAKLAFP